MATARAIGAQAEKEACAFLETQGLTLVEKNFSFKTGEIDLIMKDKDVLVFVEVRKRSHADFGSGAETVRHPKQHRIVKTALYYLQSKNLYDKCPCRIDVIEIGLYDQRPGILWFKNAILQQW